MPDKVSIFSIPKSIINSLNASRISSVAAGSSPSRLVDPLTADSIKTPQQHDGIESSTKSCRTCSIELEDEEFKTHFKSDWHRYNLKRKLLGRLVLTELEFEELDEVSSIDASDSESEDEMPGSMNKSSGLNQDDTFLSTKGSPHVRFTAPSHLDHEQGLFKELSIYKMTLLSASQIKNDITDRDLWVQALENIQYSKAPQKYYWTLIMVGAGHFAGAVFDCRTGNPVAQKTFHRYTTRRKQGGAQSSNDSAKGNAKSAGAGLRRYNEAALQKEVQDLITSWKPYLQESTHIFVRASMNNRSSLYFDKATLDADDSRIRSFPFTTRRPSFQELKRCFEELTTATIATIDKLDDLLESVDELRLKEEKPKLKSSPPKAAKQVSSDLYMPLTKLEDLSKEMQKLIEFCKKGKTEAVKNLLWDPENDSLLKEKIPDHLGISALHIAASNNHADVVAVLLECGADPTVKAEGRPARPYDVSQSKTVRDAFRRHMAKYPDQWDYEDAHIPGPLTEEMEQKQKEKEKERRKQEKERKKASSSKTTSSKKDKPVDDDDAVLAEAAALAKKEAAAMGLSNRKVGGKRLGAISLSKTDLQSIGMTTQQRALLDREKRALAAEARMRTNQMKCAACGRPLTGTTPFDKYNFKYCSLVCVQSHNGIF